MSSYLRFGRPFGLSSSPARGGASAYRTTAAATPDFGAFDLDDGDEDHDENEGMLSSPTRATSHVSTVSTAMPGGSISLGDEVTDPLTQHQLGQSATNHHATSSSPSSAPTTIPPQSFGYDFEPQAHEGGTGTSSSSSPPRPPRVVSRAGSGATTPTSAATLSAAAGTNTTNIGNNPRSLRDRFLPASLYARVANRSEADDEADGLLFDQDEDDSNATGAERRTTSESNVTTTYPPRAPGIAATHVPLPSRPPQFSVPPSGGQAGGTGRIYGGGQANDGVFGNLSAKPDGYPRASDYVGGEEGGDKDEILPSYAAAALDATPPYWETTVLTPGGILGPDDICVDGLPVGNLFGFMWNLLVSMSFQFVGFLLTYLLHTTHAAKNGSRAGLGITLIQLGFYLKQRADHPELLLMELNGTLPNAMEQPMQDGSGARWTWWGGVSPEAADAALNATSSTATSTASALGSIPTQIGGAFGSVLDASDPDAANLPSLTGNVSPEEFVAMSTAANEWLAFIMVTVGTFLFIGGCLSYWRAVRWARAVSHGQGPGMTEA